MRASNEVPRDRELIGWIAQFVDHVETATPQTDADVLASSIIDPPTLASVTYIGPEMVESVPARYGARVVQVLTIAAVSILVTIGVMSVDRTERPELDDGRGVMNQVSDLNQQRDRERARWVFGPNGPPLDPSETAPVNVDQTPTPVISPTAEVEPTAIGAAGQGPGGAGLDQQGANFLLPLIPESGPTATASAPNSQTLSPGQGSLGQGSPTSTATAQVTATASPAPTSTAAPAGSPAPTVMSTTPTTTPAWFTGPTSAPNATPTVTPTPSATPAVVLTPVPGGSATPTVVLTPVPGGSATPTAVILTPVPGGSATPTAVILPDPNPTATAVILPDPNPTATAVTLPDPGSTGTSPGD